MLDSLFLGIPLLEWIGYAASALVLLSLSMSSIVKLRWYNLVGCLLFCTYGFLIGSYPVGIMNSLIVVANIYNLRKLYSIKDDFKIVKLTKDDVMLQQYLKHYQMDIAKFYPNFNSTEDGNNLNFFVLRNMSVAGIFVAQFKEAQKVKIELDYALPQFRDLKVGTFLYKELDKLLRNEGVKKIYHEHSLNKGYLQRMGFTVEKLNEREILERNINI